MDWRDAEREYDDEVIDSTTLGRLFEDAADRHPNRPAQRYKGGIYDRSLTESVLDPASPGAFRPLSYLEMRDIVATLAAGFRALGVDRGDRVGIFAHTRMEWAQADFALLSAGAVITTVYPGSTASKAQYLLGDSGADGVVVENEELLERLLTVEDDLELEFFVSMDELSGYDDRDDIMTLADVYELGDDRFDADSYEAWLDEPDVDAVASLIYTSGTTGQPKGVALTHANIRSNINQIRKRYGPRPDKPADVPVVDETVQTVSYLPLAHIFERTIGHFLIFASGGCVAYAESTETLKEDFAIVEPNTATSVPRVYEKIYDTVREQASESALKQRIFEWATAVGNAYQEHEDPGALLRAKQAVADRLVFSTVREALGGNLKLLISGGGSLSPELCRLYHAMGLPIYEGYGLTETSPVITVNPAEETKIGTIGPPLPGVDIRIDDSVVDQEAFDDPGEVGELLVQGPNVFDQYWNLPSETDRAFTDGWFRTGDIVHRRSDGYVEFRERTKGIIVLSTGKNVAPAPIEDAFAASERVEQCLVVGDGEKFIGALIVPNTTHIREWAEREGVDLPDDPEAMCDDERVHEYIQAEVDRVNEPLEPHETIKQFELVPQEFTEANELLTPTMKKKRSAIIDRFADRVDRLYAQPPQSA